MLTAAINTFARPHGPYHSHMTLLNGSAVQLRPVTRSDLPVLVPIRRAPEVQARWGGGGDARATIEAELDDPNLTAFVIEMRGQVVGWIHWAAEENPNYRYATIDLYLAPEMHNRGLGTDAVRTLARYLIDELRHHRLEVDVAADNAAAIGCFRKVGFRPVGVRRFAERDYDGRWSDGLLMDLLAEELL